MKKATYENGSLYPHEEYIGENFGTSDIDVRPLEERYRNLIPKSEQIIKVGQTEKLPHGTLRCFMEKHPQGKMIAKVGVYEADHAIGKELLYEPTPDEIINGIPEWKFDAEQISTMGTSWDYQSTDLWIWTIAGLRKDGKMAISKNIG